MAASLPKQPRCCVPASGLMCSRRRCWLDHLIRPHQQRRRDCDSERLRSPVVDDQLEPRCLSQRQLARPSAAQDFCDLLSRAPINLGCARAVCHQTPGICKETERINHGQAGLESKLGELLRPRIRTENNVGVHEQRVRALLLDRRELWQQLFGGSDLSLLQCYSETRCGLLRQLPCIGSSLRVMQEHHPRGLGNRFVEELEALRAELRRHAGNTCQISKTPSDTCDVLEWVARVDNKRCTLHRFSDNA